MAKVSKTTETATAKKASKPISSKDAKTKLVDKSQKLTQNNAVLKKLQELWYEGGTSLINYPVLENMGLDTSETKIRIGNFLLEQYRFHNHYAMSLIDKTKDLNGKPIEENIKALKFLQAAWLNNETEIKRTELEKFALNTKLDNFTLGNFELSNPISFFLTYYDLSLKNKERGIDNRIVDDYVTVQKVLKDINNFNMEGTSDFTEKVFEEELYDYLYPKYENVHRQVSIGGLKSLKIDLDIGNGKVGVELKVADKVTHSSEKQRVIGQLHDYTDKRYKEKNLIVAIAGHPKYRIDPSVREVEKIVKNQYKCHFAFVESD